MSTVSKSPAEGDLKVWWIPQVPMTPFEVAASSIDEAAKIMDVLADYDAFQFENHVKPDYCNAGGLSVFQDGEWVGWECPETGECDPRTALEERADGGAS